MTSMSAAYYREWRRRRSESRGPRITRATARAMWDGLHVARSLGHRMGPPVRDVTKTSAIAACERCPRFVVVDLEESQSAYGGATFRPCH